MTRTSRRLSASVFLALVGALLIPTAASAAPGDTAFVDDGWVGLALHDDPAGPASDFGVDSFATISAALAATPGTIIVAAGDYTEQVVVNYAVTITGAGVGVTIIHAPDGLSLVSVHNHLSLVVVSGATASLALSGVTVRGPIENVAPGPFYAGIHVVDGGVLDISDSAVASIRDNPLGGTQRGHGILIGSRASDAGASIGTATITRVTVSDFQKIGILVRPNSTAAITDSIVQGQGPQCVNASNGIQIQGAATVTGTSVLDNRYTDFSSPAPACGPGAADAFAIAVLDATGPVLLENNTFAGNEIAIYLAAAAGVGPPVMVRGNSLTGLADDPLGNAAWDTSYGIFSAWQRDNAVITGNTITRTTLGLDLAGGGEDASSNSLRANTTGVLVEAAPSRFAANAIVGNTIGVSGAQVSGPNWWGCNDGPGAVGCDTAADGYSEPEWLVLALELQQCSVATGSSIPATVTLTSTSGGTDYSAATVPPTTISLTGNAHIALAPGTASTAAGELGITLTGLSAGPATGSAQADAAQVFAPGSGPCLQLTVLAAELAATGITTAMWVFGGLALLVIVLGVLLVLIRVVSRRNARDYPGSDG